MSEVISELKQEEQPKEQNRLKFFPIMMYAIVMGMSGLTITYQKAGEWLGFPHIFGTIFMIITTAIFFIVTAIYLKKYFTYKMAVKKEFAHPIRINFFAAVSISMLMLAIIYKEVNPTISAIFWYPGTLLHFYLTMHTIVFWINNNQELAHSNPAWFIPIVGNILVPVAGVGFASTGILMYFFSVGIFFWVILFAVILNRIIFHHQLAGKFMPTLFILIAPPAVGFIAYFKLYGQIDAFAMVMFNLGLFFTLLVAFMYKNFLKIKFFISWWAFVFPIAAMAISSMLMYTKTQDPILLVLSYVMVAVVSAIIAVVIYQTIIHMKKHDICIQE
ncbi:MAG: SLAC1 anion channel family protein [Campylobacterota bacterium]|nr:SLAC1 anion channel family protein [Campylobacterota bacterium]